ncbi:MAG TPA: SDR family oxidoreductase [Nocardioidaceae bacterium]|nr:SDR family oxidoreductase [Nocardioidaceae bacterium]
MTDPPAPDTRPVVLVTGVGRKVGIGAAIAERLAGDGWDVATTSWAGYDERMPWGRQDDDPDLIAARLRELGARTTSVHADLADPGAPAAVFAHVEAELGTVTTLVMCHCESVDSGLLDSTVESFDRHYAVNLRASWLLLKEYAERFRGPEGRGRVIALTSDAVVGNLPYGATKGALDRMVIAAARELTDLRVSANVVNPGPVDTGWMTQQVRDAVLAATPLGRAGTAYDTAALVGFLCSPEGGWVNGQLLCCDGGLHT